MFKFFHIRGLGLDLNGFHPLPLDPLLPRDEVLLEEPDEYLLPFTSTVEH